MRLGVIKSMKRRFKCEDAEIFCAEDRKRKGTTRIEHTVEGQPDDYGIPARPSKANGPESFLGVIGFSSGVSGCTGVLERG